MTTMSHKYLAYTLYDEETVNKIMSENYIEQSSEIMNLDDIVIGNVGQKKRYSNKYEKLADPPVAASVGVSGVNSWDETVLPDMNVGYTIDGFDIYGYE